MPAPRAGCARRRRPRSPPSRGPRVGRARPLAPTSAAIGTAKGSPFVQSRRALRGWPHGFWADSIARNAGASSAGKRLSSSTRLRRIPMILSTCSMSTGQASTHAPQVTQSQTASSEMAPGTSGIAIVPGARRSSRDPPRARTSGEFGITGSPRSAASATWRMPITSSFGLSGLPVKCAGQASWQRPHSVQVNPSSTSFQARSASVRRP